MENEILASQIKNLCEDVAEIKKDMQRVVANQERITRLEVQYNHNVEAMTRAFEEINSHAVRITALEVEAPITRMVRNWVITGVIGVVGLLGSQMFIAFYFMSRLATAGQ